jgi:hypothetical protein
MRLEFSDFEWRMTDFIYKNVISLYWLFRGPLLLKLPLHDVNVKVLILEFMSYLYAHWTI